MSLNTQSLQPIINFIWSVADDVLINKYLENQYQDVILPMTVLRRLDLALEPSKEKVFKTYEDFKGKIDNLSGLLTSEQHGTGLAFYNTSQYTMKKLLADPKNINTNFLDYLNGFSENVQDIISKFKFRNQLETFENTEVEGKKIPLKVSAGAIFMEPYMKETNAVRSRLTYALSHSRLEHHGELVIFLMMRSAAVTRTSLN